jgi:hypothetical protein
LDLAAIYQWLGTTALGEFMQTSDWAFPAVEVIHVIAVVLVYGVIAVVDLRLIGLAGRSRRYAHLAAESLHLVWVAFGFAVVTGLLMFTTQPVQYAANPWFVAKMVFIMLAGLNMVILELVVARRSHEWGNPGKPIPIQARLAGGLSLTFWTVVVICGRWIGFTMFAMPAFG